MENSRRKSFSKKRLILSLFCILVITVTIASNVILAVYKRDLIRQLNSRFFKRVCLQDIYYLPPNFIIIKNLGISESESAKLIFTIPVSRVNFSLWRLLLNRAFYVYSVQCFSPAADYRDFFNFVKGNFNQIWDFICRLPKQDFILSIREASFESVRKDGSRYNLKVDFFLKIAGDSLSISGTAGKTSYGFTGLLTPVGIYMDKLELKNSKLQCNLWGMTGAKIAELKGFIFINNLGRREPNSPPANLFIMDIDSRIKFDLPRVEIERLNFLINDNPVKLTADMLFSEPYICDLKLFSNFRGLNNKRKETLKDIALSATLAVQKNTLKVKSNISIDFPEQVKESLPIRKIVLDLKELILPLEESPGPDIKAAGVSIFCQTATNSYKISLEDLKAEIHRLSENTQFIKYRCRFYGGALEGRGRIEMRGYIPVITALARVKNADCQSMEEILVHFSKFYGKSSCQMSFVNYPQIAFKGGILLNDGYLQDFEFFKWLADLFDLDSLRKIFYHKSRANFLVDKDGASLRGMYLDSDDVKLNGDFKVGENDFVSSRMALSFSRPLLQKSRKFTRLLGLLHERPDFLDFDFQLSGNLHGMNFQWLKSDFKDKVQRAIPNFVQRGLQRKMEEAVESISEE